MTAAWGSVPGAAQAFWRWWAGELAASVPPRLRAWAGGGPRIFLRLTDEGFARLEIEQGRLAERGAFERGPRLGADPVPVALLVPADWALQKLLVLPPAAERHLAQVLRFEIERQTPFTADQVYVTHQVIGRDAAQKRLDVRIAVVPRARVDEAVRRAEEQGARVDTVAVDGGDPFTVAERNLLARGTQARQGWRVERLLMLLAVLLGAAALLGPDLRYGAELDRLQGRIAAEREAARRIAGERAARAEMAAAATTLAETARAAPSATLILEELSRLLPEDTWLSQITLAGRELTIEGTSASAASLVPVLESSSLFAKIGFVGATTLDARTRQERFQFTIQLREAPS